MLSIRGYRGEGPFDPFFKGVFADVAVLFRTDAAGEVEAGIGVDKELHGLTKTTPDQRPERIDLGVRFEDVEVPGHGQMAVDMQAIPIFDHPQVVKIDPVLAAMLVQVGDEFV